MACDASRTLTSLNPGAEMVYAVSGSTNAGASVNYVQPPAPSAPLVGSLGTVTQTSAAVRKGDRITYTIALTNTGSGALNNILLFAPIPTGTTFIPGSVTGGAYFGPLSLGPLAALAGVVWNGNLAAGASHTMVYAVQVQILEGQITNQPQVYVDNQDTGINLSSTVDVEPLRVYLPIVRRQ